MLDRENNTPPVLARRDFLSATAAASLAGPATASPPDDQDATKTGKSRSVIFLYMAGGPSHVDTFDYKPVLASRHGQAVPESISRRLRPTLWRWIVRRSSIKLHSGSLQWQQHGESGLWISELFAQTARHADDLCIISSMQSLSWDHVTARRRLLGGLATNGASLGGRVHQTRPSTPFFALLADSKAEVDETLIDAGPIEKQPTAVSLRWNASHRRFVSTADQPAARIELESETDSTLRSYGIGNGADDGFAAKCIASRQLVERGIPFVLVQCGNDKIAWDGHSDVLGNHRTQAERCDRAIAALLEDLKQRGMFQETLVVWASGFGRTPMAESGNGRYHNPLGFTTWLAGGGVQGGRKIGVTDEIGLCALDPVFTPADLQATILSLAGANGSVSNLASQITLPNQTSSG